MQLLYTQQLSCKPESCRELTHTKEKCKPFLPQALGKKPKKTPQSSSAANSTFTQLLCEMLCLKKGFRNLLEVFSAVSPCPGYPGDASQGKSLRGTAGESHRGGTVLITQPAF